MCARRRSDDSVSIRSVAFTCAFSSELFLSYLAKRLFFLYRMDYLISNSLYMNKYTPQDKIIESRENTIVFFTITT